MEKRCTNCGKYPFCQDIPKENCESWIKIGLRSARIENERRNMGIYKSLWTKVSN